MTSGPAPQLESPAAPAGAPLRVLLVDDSAEMRRALAEVLGSDPLIEVVGQAADGEEALRLAVELEPACVCADVEMPRMDGFTFLRLLMARRPVPVLIVSSAARKQEVFKAIELGALDFVPKLERDGVLDVQVLREELLATLATIRRLVPVEDRAVPPAAPAAPPELVEPVAAAAPAAEVLPPVTPAPGPAVTPAQPRSPLERPRANGAPAPAQAAAPAWLVVIGASTGGPTALTRLLAALPRHLPVAYAVAQHMPRPFTSGFAERLGRSSGLDVREAEDGDELVTGRVLVAPGGRHLTVVRVGGPGGALRAVVRAPQPGDGRRYCPSVDWLFESAAEAMGGRVCAVVLTGMGNDGRSGVARVKQAGGVALAESQETAVVYGMPREAAGTGLLDAVASLDELVERISRATEAP